MKTAEKSKASHSEAAPERFREQDPAQNRAAGQGSAAGQDRAAPGCAAGAPAVQGPRRGFPSAADLLVFLGIFAVANLIGTVVPLLFGIPFPDTKGLLGDDEAVRTAAQFGIAQFNAVSYAVTMSLTLGGYLFYRARRGGPRGIGRFSSRGMNPVLLLWGVLFLLSASVVLEPLLALLPAVPNVYGRGVWAVLTLVVMAPLFEEVIFRGVLLESLRRRYGVIAALLLSSLIFGLVHLHPTIAVNAFFMGLILGFFYLATESLWASVFLHAVNNGISYVLLAAGFGGTMLIDLLPDRTLYAAVYAVAAAVFCVSAFMTVRVLRRMRGEEKKPSAA